MAKKKEIKEVPTMADEALEGIIQEDTKCDCPSQAKILPLGETFGREDLNLMARKINEVIDRLNG